VLVRIAYAADLPTPDEVIRSLDNTPRGNGFGPTPSAAPGQPAPRPEMPTRAEIPRADIPRGSPRGALAAAAPAELPVDEPVERGAATRLAARALKSLDDMIALAAEKRDLAIKSALERDVRLVRFEDGRLEIGLEASAPKTLTGELSKKLADWTGRRWMVIVSAEPGMPSLHAQAQARKAELKDGVRGDPLVQAVLARFPGAEIVDVRLPPGTAAGSDEMPFDAASEAGPADEP
jgi:DNA polymerase III subunit gamma/tau